jgi:hypothetical protein
VLCFALVCFAIPMYKSATSCASHLHKFNLWLSG